MLDTLGSLRAAIVENWLSGESVPPGRINDAINDAIESLWLTLVRAAVSVFVGGPVQLSIAAASERTTLVTITNPSVAPTLSNVVQGALLSHIVNAAYTLVTESGSETLLSPVATQVPPDNSLVQVTSPTVTEGAIGWNCYMGNPTSRLAKQNDMPIPFGTSFTEPDSGFSNEPDAPSPPTENTTADNVFYLRHLEFQHTSGAYQAWEGADIASGLMKLAAGTLAASSEYQPYFWDLINQRQLELRPATGMAMVPRYFYIQKPRRIRFDNGPLPFPTIPSTEFLRAYALSRIFLSIEEFQSAEGWAGIAEAQRQRCQDALTQINRPKNNTVLQYPG